MHTSPSPLWEGITMHPQTSPGLQVYATWPANHLPLPDPPALLQNLVKRLNFHLIHWETTTEVWIFQMCVCFPAHPSVGQTTPLSFSTLNCKGVSLQRVLPAPAPAKAPSSFLNPARCVFWLTQALAGFCSFPRVRYATSSPSSPHTGLWFLSHLRT